MPTENRRIATYLPKEIDERFKAFKVERGLTGDSQALIAILSEYFGIAPQVAHGVNYQSFATLEQVEALRGEVSELAASMRKLQSSFSAASLLADRVQRMDARIEAIESERETESKVEHLSSKGQMSLLELGQVERFSLSPSAGGEPLTEPEWLTTRECLERLGLKLSYETFRKLSPEKLREYGVEVDLQRKAEDKHKPRWLRLPQSQSQVNPLPEGSERSGEG